MPKLKKNEFYCVSCRKRKTAKISDIKLQYDKKGKPRHIAKCAGCEGKLYKYIPAILAAKESKIKSKIYKSKSRKRKTKSKSKSKSKKRCRQALKAVAKHCA